MPTLTILDLGGVLFNINFARTRRALQELTGYNGRNLAFGVETQSDVFVDYDRGALSTAEFRARLRTMYGYTCTDAEIDRAWCSILDDGLFPFASDIVRSIRLRHAPRPNDRLVIFSNISELHYLDAKDRCKPVFSLVDEVYLSYILGLRKPDPQSFLTICETEGIQPSNTLLIDDSVANCTSASSLGISTILVSDPSSLL
ncbi:MAG TPA: HAD family phosphatase [Candidatus Didemnitutus sp.]|nr:HAD family phosphatase [Candidatus Didemnitutus sp.]